MCRPRRHTPHLWSSASMRFTGTKYGCGVAQCGRLLGAHQRRAAALLPIPLGSLKPATRSHHRGFVAQCLASHPERPGRARRPQCGIASPDRSWRAALSGNPSRRSGHRSGDDHYAAAAPISAFAGVHLAAGQPNAAARRLPPSKSCGGRHDHQYPRNMSAGSSKSGKSKRKVSRRGFVVGSAAATGAAALGSICRWHRARTRRARRHEVMPGWCAARHTCVFRVARSEMGQGTSRAWSALGGSWTATGRRKSRTRHAGQNLARKRVGARWDRRQPRQSAPRRIMCVAAAPPPA